MAILWLHFSQANFNINTLKPVTLEHSLRFQPPVSILISPSLTATSQKSHETPTF